MAFTEKDQIKQLIADKKQILITFRKDGKGDAIGSALALWLFLKRLDKRADIVVDGFSLPHSYNFIKGATTIKPETGHLQKFILTVDIGKTGIQELSYDVKDNELRVFITPKNGSITKSDIRTAQSDFKYDLVIALDSPDLDSLGSLYHNNTDFFHRTTVVNIDHQTNNEHFGNVNAVDLTMSTTAELLYHLLNEWHPEHVNAEVATALLTGMIAGTNSFKQGVIHPQTLATASELVTLGADRGLIIKNLFQTKSIATFKLWGAALSHLQFDETLGLAWSTITREDFVRSGAREHELHAIIDELISSAPAAKIILLLHEHPDPGSEHEIHGLMQTDATHDAVGLLLPFKPVGNTTSATFTVKGGKTLREVELGVIETLRGKLAAG